MSLVHVLCGVSNSGKSTKSKQLQTKYGGFNRATIINRDKLREQLYGFTEQTISSYYNLPDFHAMEQNITAYEDNLIRYTLQNNKVAIIDATHLRVKFLTRFHKFGVPIVYELITVDYDLALERDSKRVRQVGKAVIDKQWESLRRLKEEFDFKPWYPTNFVCPEYRQDLPEAYVWDVDGTLALKCQHRSPYEWHKVADDLPNKPIVRLFQDLKERSILKNNPTKMIICSGRDGCCEQDTRLWLELHGIYADEFYIRTPNDNRADWIVKTEFIQQISAKYNVIACIDDRVQVVDNYRRLGYCVMQVAEGNF